MSVVAEASAGEEGERVRVELGPRAYDILIAPGLLARAGALVARRLPGCRVAVVTDETVAALHLPALLAGLAAGGVEAAEPVVLPAGEATKSFGPLQTVVDRVLAARLERGDAVMALGGGVVGDLAGFAAGIVRRGMRLVQVPTTLLAQVDSSVGGKTGINSGRGKNLVGVFHQPALVLADTAVLATLPRREFAAGYAEIAKMALIDRPDFFAWLETNRAAVFAGDSEAIARAVAESCRAKAAVVEADEREEAGGPRALLNLGHTFGHALESVAGYASDRLVHGEGVAIGTVLAFRFSASLGLCAPADAERVEAHLATAGLPTRIGQIPGEGFTVPALMEKIAQDKKTQRGRLTFILARGIGGAFVANDVGADTVSAFLADEIARR